MKYEIQKLLEQLMEQRGVLVDVLSDLNENLPNYALKCNELNNQIIQIDNQIRDYVLSMKDITQMELQNKLATDTFIKSS